MNGNRADLSKADKLISQGKLQSAIEVYLNHLRGNQGDSTVHNTVGDLYVRIGEPKSAVPHFQKAADALEKSGFRSKAIAVLRKAYRQAPSNAEIVETLAMLLRDEGLVADARTMLMDLARNRQQLGHLPEARALYKKVLEIDPQNLQTLLKISELAAKEGNVEEECEAYCAVATHLANSARYEEAIEIIESAYRSSPTHKELARIYSDLLHRTGETEKARQILQAAHKTHEQDPAIMVALAELALENGKLDDALDLFNQARQRDPEAERVLLLGGSIAAAREDYDTAIGYFQPLVDKILSSSEGGPVIAAIEQLVRRHPDHIKSLNKLKSIYTYLKDKVSLARTLIRLADAHERSGDFLLAIDAAEQLQSLEPDKLSHKNRLEKLYARSQGAAIFEDTGSAHETEEVIPEALDLTLESEKEPEVDARISRILLETEVFLRYGLTPKARERLGEALTIDAMEPLVHERMAEILMEDQDIAGAAAALEQAAQIWDSRGRADKAEEARSKARNTESAKPGVAELVLSDEVPKAEDIEEETGATIIEMPGAAEARSAPMAPWVPSTDPLQGKLAEAEYYLEQNFISAAHHLLSQLREQHPAHEEVQRLWKQLETQMKSEMDVTEVEKDLDDFFTTLEDTEDGAPAPAIIAPAPPETPSTEIGAEETFDAESDEELPALALTPLEDYGGEVLSEQGEGVPIDTVRDLPIMDEVEIPEELARPPAPEIVAEPASLGESEVEATPAEELKGEEPAVEAEQPGEEESAMVSSVEEAAPVETEERAATMAAVESEEDEIDAMLEESPLQEIADILEEDLYAVHTAAVKRLDELQESHQEIEAERFFSHLSGEFDPRVLRESAAKHFEMAEAYLEAGLYEDAINEFQIAAEDPVFYQQGCHKLGICYLSKGMIDPAMGWLEKALTGGGDVTIMAESLHQLAIIHQIRGDKTRFRHAVEQLESLAPDHPGLAGLKAVV